MRSIFILLSLLQFITISLQSNLRHQQDSTYLGGAVTCRYPMHIFNSNDTNDLRNTATYSQEMIDNGEKGNKSWVHFSRSRDLKDLWLYENWFYGMRNGVILESGSEAIAYSTTYFFEYFANWTTIHVEADPEHYKNIGNFRVNSINAHTTFCNEFKLLHYSSIGKFPIRGIVEYMSESFMKRWHGRIYNNVTKIGDLPVIHCITAKSFLQEINFNHIDIWIVGNEGNDESILLGTDFKNVTFNAITMECDASPENLSKNKRKIDIIEANGFKCEVVKNSCMCKNVNYSLRSAPEWAKTKTDNNNSKRRIPLSNNSEKLLMNAVTVRYPLNIFSKERDVWRSVATLSKSDTDSSDKQYIQYSHAQDDEDVWLFENFFYGMKNGLILESGALDGLEFSTSFMFENYLNWSSIHVEADPDNFAKLLNNRLNSVNVNAALCSEPKLLHWSSYGSVNAVKGFVEFMPMDFLKRWHRVVFNNDSMIDHLPAVQCMTVKKLLQELNINHVDIWILDVEGSEESVLQGVDFDAVRFNSIVMECDEYDNVKNNRKMDFVRAKGFDCRLMYRNCICKNNLFSTSSIAVKSNYHIGRGKKLYHADWT